MFIKNNARPAFKTGIFALAALLAAAWAPDAARSGQAEPSPDPDPALWSISDADTTVYLFGTADILPPDIPWRSDTVTAAFADAGLVVLETDTRPGAQAAVGPVVQQLGVFRDGRTLSGVLNDEQKAGVAATAELVGVPVAALDPLKPWLAATQLGALNAVRQGYQEWTSLLAVLAEDAQQNDKPLRFFEESRAVLLQTISALPEQTHINMLVTAARQIRDNPDQAAETVPVWLDGNTERLADLYHGEGQWADETVYEALLVKRNHAWLERIQTMLAEEEGIIFVGVGTGHVVGPDGLPQMLRDAGLSVTRQ